jgi:GNAT superfamily N-acetyltransferase
MPEYRVRPIRQDDFFWLKDYDCAPLSLERDSVYLFFCVHFSEFSFVSVDDRARPVGFVLGFLPAGQSVAYVHFLFVEEAMRRRGVGRALMQRFIGAVRAAGARAVTLYTIRAVAFYERLGFERCAGRFEQRIADYIREVKGAAPMTLVLGPDG